MHMERHALALWRVPSYLAPGLPRPTSSHSSSPSAAAKSADADLRAVCVL